MKSIFPFNFHYGKLFWTNVVLFGLLVVTTFFTSFLDASLLAVARSFIVVLIVFPLSGINIVAVLERVSRNHFNFLEKFALATILPIIFSPLLLTIEFTYFQLLSPELPILNTLCLFLLAIILNPFSLEPQRSENEEKAVLLPFCLAFLFYFIIISFIVFAYFPLPDYDPYYWLPKFEKEFSENTVTALSLSRPLFSSLTYIFHESASIPLYTFFKYILPYFWILVLIPITLVARYFFQFTTRFALFLLPLINASVILYSLMPIPQALFNLALIFFIFFLLYAWLSGRMIFYFLAGLLIGATYLYHETAILIFLPWIITTLFVYRNTLWESIQKNKLSSFLLILLILTYGFPFICPAYIFIRFWLLQLTESLFHFQINWLFPLSYTNIDGNQVGWGNGIGVIKYYLFYAGTAVIFFLSISAFLFLKNIQKLRTILQESHGKILVVLFLSFFFFFLLAEIFPRLLNFSLLPERALGLVSIFSIALFPLIIRNSTETWRRFLVFGFFISILLNVSAAIYVNSFKKYLITPEQIDSAEWINHNLPKERLFFTRGNANLLEVHVHSPYINIENPHFYSDITIFSSVLFELSSPENEFQEKHAELLSSFSQQAQILKAQHDVSQDDLTQPIDSLTVTLEELRLNQTNAHAVKIKLPDNLYIYYARKSDKNLYASRPYFEKDKNIGDSELIFDKYPELFRRIYSIPNNEIVIWEIIQK